MFLKNHFRKDVTNGKCHFRVVSGVIPHFSDTNHGLVYSPQYIFFHDLTFTFSLSTLQFIASESCFSAVIYKDIYNLNLGIMIPAFTDCLYLLYMYVLANKVEIFRIEFHVLD